MYSIMDIVYTCMDTINQTNDREGPNGTLSELLYEYNLQLQATDRHAAIEGKSVDNHIVLESYDRVLHPWVHGRRPLDIAKKIKSWWRFFSQER